jgi:hypothetical protein
MTSEHPYRFAEPRAIVSDEAELAAIEELAARKSRLHTWVTGSCLCVAVAGGLLCWPFVNELQFALWGVAFLVITALATIFVPLAVGAAISWVLVRLLLRARADAWLTAANVRHGVPIEQLRWVLQPKL